MTDLLKEMMSDSNKADPRPDTSHVCPQRVERFVSRFVEVLSEDMDDLDHARQILALHEKLNRDVELCCAVFDELAANQVLTKRQYREYLELARSMSCSDS